MLADAEYFNSRISKLEGSDDLGPYILELVKAKSIVVVADAERPPSPQKGIEKEGGG